MKKETHAPHNIPTDLPAKKDTGKVTWMIIAIVLLVMLIILSIIGYLKFKDLNKQVTSQKVEIAELQSSKNTLEDAAKAAASAAVSTASNAVQASQIYKIPELGIQFKPGKDLQDLTYYVKTESNGNKYAYFTTSSLMTLASSKSGQNQANENLCYPGAIGSIGKTQTSSEYANKQIGNFYVGLARPQAYCSENQEVIKLENTQYDLLKSAFNSTVEAIKL